MNQRTQTSRTECPKQTLQSANTAQGRTHSQEETAFFWGDSSSFQISDISLTPLKGPSPATGNSTGSETSTGAFKLNPENCTVKQKPTQASSSAAGKRLEDATQTTVLRTAKNFLSNSSSLMSVQQLTELCSNSPLSSHFTCDSEIAIPQISYTSHAMQKIFSQNNKFSPPFFGSSRTASAHELIPSLLIHLQVTLLLISPNCQETLCF